MYLTLSGSLTSPSTSKAAAELAATLGIKVYTVAAGTNGLAPFPATDFFGRKVYRQAQTEVDEETLREVAQITQAAFFRATDKKSLQDPS